MTVILDAIRRAAVIAQTLDDVTAAGLACELIEQIPRSELNLLVVGQFKRGKSSLVNALLGADVMPTGALPVTGIATAIRYGEQSKIEVTFRDNGTRSISPQELAVYVSEQLNPANRLGVERVEVSWPSETIRGLALFDTPGIGSTFTHNTAAARAALPRADAAVLVVGPDPPIGADELQYARDVVAASERLFVVLNKSDIAGNSLLEILGFTRDTVRRVVGDLRDVEVIPLSATRAREAQRAERTDAAFSAFADSLRHFVNEHGAIVRERSIRRRAVGIVARLEALLAMRSAALHLPRVERERRKTLAERALQAVEDRARALELTVDDDVRSVRLDLEEEMDHLHDRDITAFRALAGELSSEPSPERRSERLEKAVAEHASAWRRTAVDVAAGRLRAHAAKYGRLLAELEASALDAGCDVLHVDARALAPRTIEFAPAKLDLVASVMPTTGLEVVVALATDILPAMMRKPILKHRYEELLARELDALRGKLRYGIAHDLEPWRRSVKATIASAIDGARHAILSAFGDIDKQAGRTEEGELLRAQRLEQELRHIRSTLEPRNRPLFDTATARGREDTDAVSS